MSDKKLNPNVEENDEIIALISDDGDKMDFVEIACITLNNKYYAILQPVELLDGMEDDEAFVFEVTFDKDGENHFYVELNEDIIDEVFAEYNRLLDEQESK